MSLTNWFVLTGCACSGKTTIIDALANLKYKTLNEIAREVISEGLINHYTEMYRFQLEVLKRHIDRENKLPQKELIFLDRALPDSVAYMRLWNYNADEVLPHCRKNLYSKVFLLERLPFKIEYARRETSEMLQRTQVLLEEAYTSLNYEVIKIPAISVEERIKLILKYIQ